MGMPGAEIDDGLTILYLLAQPTVRLVGISATNGNGTVADAMRQTHELLARLQTDVPLYAGTAAPAADDAAPAADDAAPAADDAQPSAADGSPAARAIVRASHDYEGRVVVLGLGALTNVAAAIRLDPSLPSRIAAINVMGGYRAPLSFPRRDVNELNFSSDPAAAHRVLNAGCPVTVMSAQLCLQARFGVRHLLVHNRGPAWLRPMVAEWYHAFSGATGAPGFYLWDLVPAAAVVEPERFPPVPYRLGSTVHDLDTGELVLEPVSEAARPTVDLREPGIVLVPDRIRARHRFAGERARAWNSAARAAVAGTRTGANGV